MRADGLKPLIIQGGMGVNISNWQLANIVSRSGQLGTVSGVALEKVVARILQTGDPGGHIRRALATFPFPEEAARVIDDYYVPEGIQAGAKYKSVPMYTIKPARNLINLTICANYATVWLAREGHSNQVGINYLEKIAMPHVYAIAGAILAGVDYVIMGAGIPMGIPAVIGGLVNEGMAAYDVPVTGSDIKKITMRFNLLEFYGVSTLTLKKPVFVPIVSSYSLANIMANKLGEGIQGLVVEEPTAGGHNAPPRGQPQLDEAGRRLPIYGEKDVVDYAKVAALGLPFWIAGSRASPEALVWALSVGAAGIQVGSIFALCEESGLDPALRAKVRRLGFLGRLEVVTDMRGSPTGFPFKVVRLPGTLADLTVYAARSRVCDQGGLVALYEEPGGTIGYRCPAEPIAHFGRKGGKKEDTDGRLCLCNGLIGAANLGNPGEPAIVTMGDDVSFLPRLMLGPDDSYRAVDVLSFLLQ